MDEEQRQQLVRTLRTRVGRFFRSKSRARQPLFDALERIACESEKVVVFGGVIRDLMVSRGPVLPRDVDVVVSGASIERLERVFGDVLLRRTRFGGLCLNVSGWRIDLWPLEETWAFRTKQVTPASFHSLPMTTFLNIEAVAVEYAPKAGRAREIYSNGFFEALSARTIELNLEANPYPDLAIARALITAANLRFRVGERLVRYVLCHIEDYPLDALIDIQRRHYGVVRRNQSDLGMLLTALKRHHSHSPGSSFMLPPTEGTQLGLWESQNWDLITT